MSEYQENLKKIVGVNKIKSELKELKDQLAIISKRGIATQDYQAVVQGAQAGAGGGGGGGGTLPPGFGTDPVLDGLLEGANDPGNAEGGLNGDGDSSFDLEQLIDQLVDKAVLEGENGVLGVVTGWTDPLTGASGEISPFGNHPWGPKDGSWVGAEDPPAYEGFIQGVTWQSPTPFSGFPGPYFATAQEALDWALSDWTVGGPTRNPASLGALTSPVLVGGPGQYRVFAPITDPTGVYNWQADSVPCLPGSSDACPLEAPSQTSWNNAGSAFQLYRDFLNGTFRGSQYDPNLPAKYKYPTSTVVMEMASGGRYSTLRAGINGGAVLYESDTTGVISPGAQVHVFDSRGGLIGYYPTAQLNNWLP